jgi:hypothetical protein
MRAEWITKTIVQDDWVSHRHMLRLVIHLNSDFSKTPVNGSTLCRILDCLNSTGKEFGVAEAVAQLGMAIGKLGKPLRLTAMNLSANLYLRTILC